MKTTSVTQLKNNLSARLKEVAAGQTILITDRRRPVASLKPLASDDAPNELAALSARGIISPPQKSLPVDQFLSLPRAECGGGLSQAIIGERSER